MRKRVDKSYLSNNTIRNAEDMLVGGIQLVKVDNLKVKKRLDDNTVIYYVKGSAKKSNIQTKNKQAKKVEKIKIKKKLK